MFCGKRRKNSVATFLRKMAALHDIQLEVIELDIQRDRKCDLTLPAVQKLWLSRITSGEFMAVMLTPPCSTFSRAVWANDRGPYPVRSYRHPRGFPWNARGRRVKAELGNILADVSFEAFKRQAKHRPGLCYMEQPEDLGTPAHPRIPGDAPASMWQFHQFGQLLGSPGVQTVVFSQLDFGSESTKPTRFLLHRELPLHPAMRQGPPEFDEDGHYQGPLEYRPGKPLIGQTSGQFRTSAAAAWPGPLCQWVAQDIITTYLRYRGKRGAEDDGQEGVGSQNKRRKLGSTSQAEEEGESDPYNPKVKGGEGPPRKCTWKGMDAPFHDGGGLPSQGRWPREKRKYPEGERWSSFRKGLMELLVTKTGGVKELEKEAFRMAKGGDHFSLVKDEGLLEQIRELIVDVFGLEREDLEVAEGQPFRLRLMARVLEEAGDADFQFLREAEVGLPVGVKVPLPRTPAIFERQTKWALEDLGDEGWEVERSNYPSAVEHRQHLRDHLEQDLADGLVEKMADGDFVREFGDDRAVASLAVLVEDPVVGKKRVIHDGTHGIGVNHRIRCQDKVRMPGPREKRALLEEFKERKETVLSIIGDFEKAHQRFKYRRDEQGYLACRVEEDDGWVYVNKVGTFGVASAPYWLGRLSAALVRLTHSCLGRGWPLELMLYADDLEVMAPGQRGRIAAVAAYVVMAVMGAPFKWKKQRGGLATEWVGICTNYENYSLGISQKRAQWVVDWIDGLVMKGSVNPREFAAGLGRLGFAALALPGERPFLGPLYAWSSAVSGNQGEMTLPFILKWLRKKFASGAGMQVVEPKAPKLNGLRIWTDAKATDEGAWVGGWLEEANDMKACSWFSMEVTEEIAPWLRCRGSPKRVIAALELLGTLIAVKLWAEEDSGTQVMVEAFTDNQGNNFALKKGMSTKFPLTVLIMELSELMHQRQLQVDLTWVRRDDNQGADDLTNLEFSKFDLSRRREITERDLEWIVMDDLLKESEALYKEVRERQEANKARKKASLRTSTKSGKVFGTWAP